MRVSKLTILAFLLVLNCACTGFSNNPTSTTKLKESKASSTERDVPESGTQCPPEFAPKADTTDMVFIRPGSITAYGPQNVMKIGQPFCMDIADVTVDEFTAVESQLKAVDSDAYWVTFSRAPQYNLGAPNRGSYPANGVNWHAAYAYCQVANKRLPTEAEWEYAYRADSNNTAYWWGNCFECDRAVNSINTNQNAGKGCGMINCDNILPFSAPTVTTGDRCNGWELCDMSGNLWKWTQSLYDNKKYPYPFNGYDDPRGPRNQFTSGGSQRAVHAGGAWNNVYPVNFNATQRDGSTATAVFNSVGFRCVVD